MKVKSSAPGKLILTGEHAVVYGYPALATAVSLQTKTQAATRKDKKRVFKSNIPDATLLRLAAEKTFTFTQNPKAGFTLTLESSIPVGSGMGSSASVSAACASALLRLLGEKPDKELLNKIVYETEKEVHANPSGIDNTTIVYGGFIKFQKTNDKFRFKQLKEGALPKFILIQSGRPKETTREMVLLVKKNMEKNRPILEKIGKVSQKFIVSFQKGNFDPDLVRQNQRLLKELGVVGEKADKIVHLIEEAGGVAKICGAGGVKQGSGILLAYHSDPAKLKAAAQNHNWEFFSVQTGVGGAR